MINFAIFFLILDFFNSKQVKTVTARLQIILRNSEENQGYFFKHTHLHTPL